MSARCRSLVSVCCLYYLLFTYKGKEDKARGWENPAEIITSYYLLYGETREELKAGETAEGVEKSAENIQKKYKKPIDKSEQVCYNRGKVEAKPPEAVRKKAGKIAHNNY